MKIWVDADAMPRAVKEVLYRAAQKRRVPITFVANRFLSLPSSPYLQMIQVGQGADVADDRIVELSASGDLVISADIPLAARVVEKGATVLQPHGRVLDSENVGEALSFRDFGDILRNSGIETGGPPPFSASDKGKFSNALDRWITRNSPTS